jgi:DNA-binding response OmpR family regulator
VARVAVLCQDLLFGSKLVSAMEDAGHEVDRLTSVKAAREAAPRGDVVLVDLTDEELDGAGLVEYMRESGELGSVGTLGFYAHVDRETRARAEEAGFDLVVPRSRMARESTALVERLLDR